MDTQAAELPLFPLRTVLFAGGRLPLKIFEPRYLDMVSRCMRDSTGFGVVLIREGSDALTGPEAETPAVFQIGTLSSIVDFNPLPDGCLGIIASGGAKFRVMETWETDARLMMGRVHFLPEEARSTVAEEFQGLVDVLKELVKHPMIERMQLDIDFDDARSVGWRLSELLPLEPEIKQSLLQMHLPRERLSELRRLVNKLRG